MRLNAANRKSGQRKKNQYCQILYSFVHVAKIPIKALEMRGKLYLNR